MENPFKLIDERLERIENLLLSLLEEKPIIHKVSTVKDMMTTSELADYLSISKSLVYKLTMNNEIPFSKPSKRIFFYKKEIDEWVQQHRNKTKYEIEQEASNYILRHPLKS